MNDKRPDFIIAEIMAKIEEMISSHYTAYAGKFPEHMDFWLKIASEETDHARWIRDLYSKTKDGSVTFNSERFNGESLKELSGRMEKMLMDFQDRSKSMRDALSNSLIVESLLLEKNCFEVFKADTAELRGVLTRLAEATREHRLRLEDMLKKL
jgi:rubrerythrin